jgi:glycosyltransferase involved in cell wall biosynthesis
MPSLRVLIYEPGAGGGHRLTYVRHAVQALETLRAQGAQIEILVAIGRGVEQEQDFTQQLAPLQGAGVAEFVITEPAPKHGTPKPRGKLLVPFAELITRHKPDHVLIPTSDNHVQMMGTPGFATRHGLRRGKPEIEAVLHQGSFAYPFGGAKQRVAKRIALELLRRSPISRLLLVDVVAYRWIREHGGKLSKIADVLPDPADDVELVDRQVARQRLGLPVEGALLVSAGQQNDRKGADLLLRAYALGRSKKLLTQDDRLLLAGKCSEPIQAMLRSECAELVASGSIIVMDDYLSNEALSDAIASADVVLAAHNAHKGLSNIVLRSVAAERPVLTSAYGWFEEVVPRFGIGQTVDVSNPLAFAQAMRSVVDQHQPNSQSASHAALRRFHSVGNFRATTVSRLRERLGMPPDPARMTWEEAVREASYPGMKS